MTNWNIDALAEAYYADVDPQYETDEITEETKREAEATIEEIRNMVEEADQMIRGITEVDVRDIATQIGILLETLEDFEIW